MTENLETLTALSHAFGVERYARGGGGNTSVKDRDRLWVKPSGCTLRDMTPDRFVELSRGALERLYTDTIPAGQAAQEAAVKAVMMAAVASASAGRPSVEAPLHASIPERFVVHTHPALVNGMLCAVNGRETCASLFPDALWVDYVDPGYTLCVHLRGVLDASRAATGRTPRVIMLKNHGIFVSGDTAAEIHATYAEIMAHLENAYAGLDIATELAVGPAPAVDRADEVLAAVRQAPGGEEATAVVAGGAFTPFCGPLSPDHIVYAGTHMFIGDLTDKALSEFHGRYGAGPRAVSQPDGSFGLGANPKAAGLALEFARDAALVEQLAEAFGGPNHMDERAVAFIRNWEVEAYRHRVATAS